APPAGVRSRPPRPVPLPRDGARVRYVRPEGPAADLDGAALVLSPVRDRSGYRTGSPRLKGGAGDLPSEGAPPGTIQLPPDGRAIFLLAERPTTGGYEKAGFVASVDLRLVAQLPPGARVRL